MRFGWTLATAPHGVVMVISAAHLGACSSREAPVSQGALSAGNFKHRTSTGLPTICRRTRLHPSVPSENGKCLSVPAARPGDGHP